MYSDKDAMAEKQDVVTISRASLHVKCKVEVHSNLEPCDVYSFMILFEYLLLNTYFSIFISECFNLSTMPRCTQRS